MKKLLLITSFLLLNIAISLGVTHTIINSGFTFSPDNLTINQGDTIIFEIASIHSALEVSKTTWDANGNTALSGGFHVPFGGGKLSSLSVGTHYYVCENHYFMGMKGIIVVNPGAGIENFSVNLINDIIVYPNPVTTNFFLKYSVNEKTLIDISLIDLTGKTISNYVSEQQLPGDYRLNIDNNYIPGLYFIRYSDKITIKFQKILIL